MRGGVCLGERCPLETAGDGDWGSCALGAERWRAGTVLVCERSGRVEAVAVPRTGAERAAGRDAKGIALCAGAKRVRGRFVGWCAGVRRFGPRTGLSSAVERTGASGGGSSTFCCHFSTCRRRTLQRSKKE